GAGAQSPAGPNGRFAYLGDGAWHRFAVRTRRRRAPHLADLRRGTARSADAGLSARSGRIAGKARAVAVDRLAKRPARSLRPPLPKTVCLLRGGRNADPCGRGSNSPPRDGSKLNRHRALDLCWSMSFSENRYPLFRIMLWASSQRREPLDSLGWR